MKNVFKQLKKISMVLSSRWIFDIGKMFQVTVLNIAIHIYISKQ